MSTKMARFMSSDVSKLTPTNAGIAQTKGLKPERADEPGKPLFPNESKLRVMTYKEIDNLPEYEKSEAEQNVSDMLKQKAGSAERTDFFMGLSEHKDGDHSQVKKAKDGIRRLIEEELEFLGFKEQLAAEEEAALVDSTYQDVEERSSFFFKYDNKLKDKNLRINDVNAPGNKHKKVSLVYPHEHVHPQHLIDSRSMTNEDVQELYGLYTYYVDLHISQVRRDVEEKTYIPPQFNQLLIRDENQNIYNIDNKFFDYYHRWREPTRTWRSQTQEIDHENLLASLPEDPHPDSRKLTKHEIEWTEDQKFPHVANRKGYPIL